MRKMMNYFAIIAILNLLALLMLNVNAETTYDIEYEDSTEDVYLFGEESNIVSGFDHIDILSIRSYEALMNQNIALEMKVLGVIRESDMVNYNFYIIDNHELKYIIMYQNGTCTGMSMDDENSKPDILVTTGTEADTLKVTLPINKIDDISEFDFYGEAIESMFDDESFIMYMDQVPDSVDPYSNSNGNGNGDSWEEDMVFITDPVHGSTVFKTCTIKGITNNFDYEIETVEMQIDTTSEGSWVEVKTVDDWETWNYQWDTTTSPDGKHELHVRAFDGFEYYYDTITVYVDQQCAESPKMDSKVPAFQMGDKFEYKTTVFFDDPDLIEYFNMDGSLKIEIIELETEKIAEKEFDVYVFEIEYIHEISSDYYSSKNMVSGKTYVQRSNLALVKEDMVHTTIEESFDEVEEYSDHEVTVYNPPMDKYNFPITISEKWEPIVEETTKNTVTSGDETYTEEYTYTTTIRYECLRYEQITVPAGTFEVYLVYHFEEPDEDWVENYEHEDYEEDSAEFPFQEQVYSIEYYSPELGFPVKMEYYDHNRQLIYSNELVSYKHEDVNDEPSSEKNDKTSSDPKFELSFQNLVILIIGLIILIIIIIGLVRMRRRAKTAKA